ncbi:MAG: glycosyltransferase [Acidimicrobiia bacterium]
MRVAVLSLHTSPLAQPGSSDAGGMNVYVRELVAGLAHTGADCTIYVRTWRDDLPEEVLVEPGVRVVHVPAGEPNLPKERLPEVIDEFTDRLAVRLWSEGADVLHANYWLSGVAGHRLKHELGVPLVCTFHTLARVKAEAGDHEPEGRVRAEAEIVGCADVVLASCTEEAGQFRRLYGDIPGRIEIVAPGVEHAFFSPGPRSAARRALGLDPQRPVVLFAGRIQPLKGVDVAVQCMAALDHPTAQLVIVGGASGLDGHRELTKVRRMIAAAGLEERVRFFDPQPHHALSSFYRAADVCLVPSRSESFGLVALEAAACGTPVVAAAVGGLRTIVDHGRTGFLVEGRDPHAFAAYTSELLESPLVNATIGSAAALKARRFTWSAAADRLRGVCDELTADQLVLCS